MSFCLVLAMMSGLVAAAAFAVNDAPSDEITAETTVVEPGVPGDSESSEEDSAEPEESIRDADAADDEELSEEEPELSMTNTEPVTESEEETADAPAEELEEENKLTGFAALYQTLFNRLASVVAGEFASLNQKEREEIVSIWENNRFSHADMLTPYTDAGLSKEAALLICAAKLNACLQYVDAWFEDSNSYYYFLYSKALDETLTELNAFDLGAWSVKDIQSLMETTAAAMFNNVREIESSEKAHYDDGSELIEAFNAYGAAYGYRDAWAFFGAMDALAF